MVGWFDPWLISSLHAEVSLGKIQKPELLSDAEYECVSLLDRKHLGLEGLA